MKKITILGAGLSATSLINYLLERAEKYDWTIKLGDYDLDLAKSKVNGNPRGEAFQFDVTNEALVADIVSQSDIVVSMMPASFHHIIAKECVKHKKNMLTASYVSEAMKELNDEAKEAGVGLFNELGVDPGIDHMSAMRIIDNLRDNGNKLNAFFSFTGGLVAPEYDNNPWNYKFTWNPRNVVLAGQGISMFIRNGKYKYIPYQQLFRRVMTTTVDGYGEFEVYPNRDSLSYRETYGLEDIPTIFRGTMRRPGYTKAWNVFVQLGATDDTYTIEDSENMTYRDFINTFLPYERHTPVEVKIQHLLPELIDEEVMTKLVWLDIFSHKKVELKNATPAQILQKILEEKWQLDEGDKDMIVMQHRFEFTDTNDIEKAIISSMVMKGESLSNTAMAITVGLPLAIATKMVANGETKLTGVQTPVIPELYNPILDELAELGIEFTETEERI
jgi:saccharopine dehydrogenase-like NADP-dependent oxidoreductase